MDEFVFCELKGVLVDLDWKPFLGAILLKLCYLPVRHLSIQW